MEDNKQFANCNTLAKIALLESKKFSCKQNI